MVYVKDGMVSAEGITAEILADISALTNLIINHGLKGLDTKEEAKEAVLRAVELGFKTEEELDQEVAEALKELKSELEDGADGTFSVADLEALPDELFSTEGGDGE